MIFRVCKLTAASAIVLVLTACGGSDPTITDTVLVYAPAKQASMERGVPGQAPLAHAQPVLASTASDSERQAEELRMVAVEQAQSIELNRRHAEQLEREQRVAANARAGVVQSPGCEDTTGHEAVICEQRVARL